MNASAAALAPVALAAASRTPALTASAPLRRLMDQLRAEPACADKGRKHEAYETGIGAWSRPKQSAHDRKR